MPLKNNSLRLRASAGVRKRYESHTLQSVRLNRVSISRLKGKAEGLRKRYALRATGVGCGFF
jgi:hypothetical protein